MKVVYLFFALNCLSSFNIFGQTNDKTKFVLEKFNNKCETINKIEYNIQRIDTFSSGHVWNKNGYAIIEKVKSDLEYGYHFFGDNISVKHISIYDGNNYTIDKKEKKYYNSRSLKGSPGEQMVSAIGEIIFTPVSNYIQVFVEETDQTYRLEYTFENDTIYNIENIKKMVELDKVTFLPLKISNTSYSLGNRSAHHFILSNLKINSEVTNTVEKAKSILEQYSHEERKKQKIKSVVNKIAPNLNLPKLLDSNSIGKLQKNKVTLIDFWEVWCSPCIISLPKVEKLHKKYFNRINVFGIVSDDIENAKKMLDAKNITFESLVGNKNILSAYEVNSYPRYFLIDRKGKVVKEYHGFSNDIEKDINKLLE